MMRISRITERLLRSWLVSRMFIYVCNLILTDNTFSQEYKQ